MPPSSRRPATSRFLNRELSWLEFNRRVLYLAADVGQPLLERVGYAAIFAGNLDEFFQVRVAGLKRRIATGIAVRAASGLTPKEVLESIWNRAHLLQLQQAVSAAFTTWQNVTTASISYSFVVPPQVTTWTTPGTVNMRRCTIQSCTVRR